MNPAWIYRHKCSQSYRAQSSVSPSINERKFPPTVLTSCGSWLIRSCDWSEVNILIIIEVIASGLRGYGRTRCLEFGVFFSRKIITLPITSTQLTRCMHACCTMGTAMSYWWWQMTVVGRASSHFRSYTVFDRKLREDYSTYSTRFMKNTKIQYLRWIKPLTTKTFMETVS